MSALPATNIPERAELERITTHLVRNEVHLCLSSLVATLAAGQGCVTGDENRNIGGVEGYEAAQSLAGLVDQAAELCAPLDDWEEAAIQHGAKLAYREDDGWIVLDQNDKPTLWNNVFASAELAAAAYCAEYNIEPYQREIFEHWAVSKRLAEDLQSLGERVDTDFAGMCVWGRTTTFQIIEADAIMLQVAQLVHDRAKAITEEVA